MSQQFQPGMVVKIIDASDPAMGEDGDLYLNACLALVTHLNPFASKMSPNQDRNIVIQGYCVDKEGNEKEFIKTPRECEVTIVTGLEAESFEVYVITKGGFSL